MEAAAGKRPDISVFGDDYPTPDGTAVRDYIHVLDLSQAHLLALGHLQNGGSSEFVNLGNGKGFSVLEVIEAARKITNRPIEFVIKPQPTGNPSCLIADSTKAREVLGWNPQFADLETIIESAWSWHQANSNGYDD